MNLLSPGFLAFTDLFSLLLFALLAYVTRATWLRVFGAFIASLPVVYFVFFVDHIALQNGWWFYPAVPQGPTPLAWCIAAALVFGGAMGLIGWRIIRRFGLTGLVCFVLSLALVGIIRDISWSHFGGLISFGPGPIPILADFLAYASVAILVQLIMRVIVGNSRADKLTRSTD